MCGCVGLYGLRMNSSPFCAPVTHLCIRRPTSPSILNRGSPLLTKNLSHIQGASPSGGIPPPIRARGDQDPKYPSLLFFSLQSKVMCEVPKP
jgi:hypothetical protein